MIKNRTIKTIISILIMAVMIMLLGQNAIYAKDETVITQLSKTRWVKDNNGEYKEKRAYALNTGSNKPIFQILSVDSSGKKLETNYYCLNALKGASWLAQEIGTPAQYDKSYDIVKDKEEISKLVTTYSDVVNSQYYTQLVWLLDNMYTEGGITVKDLLAKAGIVKGNTQISDATLNGEITGYYYDPTVNPTSTFATKLYSNENFKGNTSTGRFYGFVENKEVKDVVLSEDMVETIQQAAIWYFTNYLTNNNTEFNTYTSDEIKNWLRYSEDASTTSTSWSLLGNEKTTITQTTQGGTEIQTEINTGAMLQEQASILFNYFVDGANKAAKDGYTPKTEGTLKLSYVENNSNSRIVEDGENYKIGPMKITTTGNTTVGEIKVTTGTNTNITTRATIKDTEGKTITTLKSGTNFYVVVPKSIVEEKVKIDINGSFTTTEKKLWIKQVTDDENAEQPLAQIKPKSGNLQSSLTVTLNKQFDLALRKIITKVVDSTGKTKAIINENGLDATRKVTVNTNTIPDTATYKHRKDPIVIEYGDIVTYNINIYNEGEVDGYVSKIVDQLPSGLESIIEKDQTITSSNGNVYKVTAYDKTNNRLELTIDKTKTITSLKAYNESKIESDTIELKCKVVQNAETDGKTKHYLTNIAYIAEAYDKDENKIEADRDGNESKPLIAPEKAATELNTTNANNYKGNSKNQSVYNDTNNNYFYEGEEDDDDFEKLVVLPKVFDLSLRKFISKVSKNGNFETVTDITQRAPEVNTTKLKNGSAKTAIYNHGKEPIRLEVGYYILYTIRVYNEGDIDGYASQIIDYLPENLDFVNSTDTYIKSINDNWIYDNATRKVTTKATAPNATTILKAFDKNNDDGKGSKLSYVDVQIICKINKNAQENKKITNIAEITEYKDKDGNNLDEDIDSKPKNIKYPEDVSTYKDNEINKDYVPGQEDDDDFEKVIVEPKKKFDLALRKFITDIGGKEVTARIPKVTYENNKIIYTHPKDVIKLHVDDIVTYTLRIYNEGEISGFAEKITDDIPEYLEYLPENSINKEYRWIMYDSNGKETSDVKDAAKIVTDYASKEYGEMLMQDDTSLTENPNLLKAFDKNTIISETNPQYIDIKVAFRVKDPNSNKIIIVNKAQISEDADENGEPVDDIDSIPDKWNEGEDDQDFENVSVEYFDLSLLKYVTKAMVTEKGKTKTTKTGNTGASTDIIPKVEIYRKSVNKTIVKFEYTIKITNEGDIEGYAKEITDYVPTGLKFYSEDNKGWKDEGNNIISTELLKDTLLKPGQSATVTVILRWINGENNLGLKTNVAEISKDYNEKEVPDRDSTPDNKKTGEDDIDDAKVMLTISTGIRENPIAYACGTLAVLTVIGIGIVSIKKYVL